MKKRKFIIVAILFVGMASVGASNLLSTKASENEGVSVVEPDNNLDVYSDPVEEIEQATERMNEEEEYIVNLVSNETGEKLNTSEWEKCLGYLENNYQELVNNDGVDIEKVDSYIEGYRCVRDEKNGTDIENISDDEIITRSDAYDPKKVTEYTDKWWNSHNPNYPYYSADCANFVSQAVKAGGKKMVGSNYENSDHWFCNTKSTKELKKVSLTWRTASGFSKYWRNHSKGKTDYDRTYFDSASKFKTIYKKADVGDPISLINYNDRVYHTLIISYKVDGALKCAAHTSPHKWKSIYNLVNESDPNKHTIKMIRVYDMK